MTVHKAQGSEFGLTLLVIPRDTRLLSRELLYTALTRHQNRVVLLHQRPLADLRRFTTDAASEAARRFTNLLALPTRMTVAGVSLEGGLLHRTARGEWVRSASEVLIADGLFAQGLEYGYEQALASADGSVRYPAFSALDPDTGLMFYWEHLGLSGDVAAAARWSRKLDWYRAAGIRPLGEGGGSRGVVVWSQDRPHEPLTAAAVAEVISAVQES